MTPSEFDMIRRYFTAAGAARADVALGVGDDGALLEVPPGHRLVVTTDTLVAGVHFPPSLQPGDLGYRVLAVSLSDLAAMGAEPAGATLALTMPSSDAHWLQAFARGFDGLAREFGVSLVGGDTCRGPLSITVTLHGLLRHSGLRRAGARPGDGIYVTGTAGDAAGGLAQMLAPAATPSADMDYLATRFARPRPRVREGLDLAAVASAAIDVSDGLVADLGRLLDASGVGGRIALQAVPLSAELRRARGVQAVADALGGGDLGGEERRQERDEQRLSQHPRQHGL